MHRDPCSVRLTAVVVVALLAVDALHATSAATMQAISSSSASASSSKNNNNLRVTIFNDVPAHFEVLAGAVDTVRTYLHTEPQIVWTTTATNNCAGKASGGQQQQPQQQGAPRKQRTPPFRMLAWLGDAPGHPSWHHFPLCTAPSAPSTEQQLRSRLSWSSTDVLICISPELDKDVTCHAVARVLRARVIVALVHRADMISRGSRFLIKPPAPQQLMALAPHVASAVSRRLHDQVSVGWVPLVAAYKPTAPCTRRDCLRGFTVQGTLRKWTSRNGSGMIRDFAGLWQQLLQTGPATSTATSTAASTAASRPSTTAAVVASINVTVLGKGNRRDLDIPPQLDHRVDFQSGLPYPAFWQIVYSSYALVPAFGNDQYLKTRISSTVLASLTTCVPMIANQKILDVYSFFREEHVFLQRPGEREVDVMVRILQMDEQAVFARRQALCRLREELGGRAALTLRDTLAAEVSSKSGKTAVGNNNGVVRQ